MTTNPKTILLQFNHCRNSSSSSCCKHLVDAKTDKILSQGDGLNNDIGLTLLQKHGNDDDETLSGQQRRHWIESCDL